MTKPDQEVCHLLMAQVINNSLLRLRPKSATVEIPLLRFLADLNNLAHSYKDLFHIQETFDLFNVEFLENSIKSSGFKSFSTIKDDVLQIEVIPKKFQAKLTSIIVEASVKRGLSLIKDIDQLRSRYPTASSEPKVEPASSVNLSELTGPTDSLNVAEASAADGSTSLVDTSMSTDAVVSEEQLKEHTNRDVPVYSSSNLVTKSDNLISLDSEPVEVNTVKLVEDLMNTSLITDLTSEKADEKVAEDEFVDAVLEPELSTNSHDNKMGYTIEDEKTVNVDPIQTDSKVTDLEATKNVEMIVDDASHETSNSIPSDADTDLKEETQIEPVIEVVTTPNEAKSPIELKSESSHSADEEETEDGPPRSNRTRTHSIQSTQKRSASPLSTLSPHKHKRFQSIAINLLKSIEGHRFSSPFLSPVTAPDYSDTIKEATDLKSIMKAVKLKQEPPKYENLKELERDIMLMFANCVMFNKSSTPIVDMAKEMKDEVSKTFKMFEDAESTLNQ